MSDQLSPDPTDPARAVWVAEMGGLMGGLLATKNDLHRHVDTLALLAGALKRVPSTITTREWNPIVETAEMYVTNLSIAIHADQHRRAIQGPL